MTTNKREVNLEIEKSYYPILKILKQNGWNDCIKFNFISLNKNHTVFREGDDFKRFECFLRSL